MKVFFYYVKGGGERREERKKAKHNNIYVSRRIKQQRGTKILKRRVKFGGISSYK